MRKSTRRAPSASPTCPHRPPCPGCPRFGRDGIGPRALGALRAVADAAGVTVAPPIEGAPWAFRTRARLAVRGRTPAPKIGIFQTGTHRIADVPRCPIHHPRINAVAAAVKTEMRALGLAPYADRPHRGLLRYLQVAIERGTERAQIVLVANDATPDALAPLAGRLAERLGEAVQSLWWNGQPARTNAVLGPWWHRWSGAEALVERIGGADVFSHPGAFHQSNDSVLDPLVAAVQGSIPSGARVLELYAGAGALTLGTLSRVAALAWNEANPHGVWGLERGRAARPAAERARARLLPGPAADYVAHVRAADVVVADPPRRGLDPPVRAALAAASGRVVLVSCAVDAFVRDATALVAGGLRLRRLQPIAAFRFTDECETVAVFERA